MTVHIHKYEMAPATDIVNK